MPSDKLGCHIKNDIRLFMGGDPRVMAARKAHFAALRKWWQSASIIEIPPNVLESVYVQQPKWFYKSLIAAKKTKAK